MITGWVEVYRVIILEFKKDNTMMQVFPVFDEQKERERVLTTISGSKSGGLKLLFGIRFGTRKIVYANSLSGARIMISEELIPDNTIYLPDEEDSPEGTISIVKAEELPSLIGPESEWRQAFKEYVIKNPNSLYYVYNSEVIFCAEKYIRVSDLQRSQKEPVL